MMKAELFFLSQALLLAGAASATSNAAPLSRTPTSFGEPLRLAFAQDDDLDDEDDLDEDDGDLGEEDDELIDDEGDENQGGVGPGESEVEVGGETQKESVGGATGFVFPTGFYVSGDLGGNMRFGGYGDDAFVGSCVRCVPKLVSNLQPWAFFNIGYDIFPFLGVEFSLGSAFIGDTSAVGYDYAAGEPAPAEVQDTAENSSVTMANIALTTAYYGLFSDRLALHGKIFLGGALLSPDPDPSRLNVFRSMGCDGGGWGDPSPDPECGGSGSLGDLGISFGVGMGLRYATLLTNVVIGVDLNIYGVFSPNVGTGHIGQLRYWGINNFPPTINLGSPVPIIPAISFPFVLKYVL